MRFINEKTFLETISQQKILVSEDEQALAYEPDTETFGFDFTNLGAPVARSDGDKDTRSVERKMIATVFTLFEALNLFPITLFAINDDWVDEDSLGGLIAAGTLNGEEKAMLKTILANGNERGAIVAKEEESEPAALLLLTEMTLLTATTCAVVSNGGEVIVHVSYENEVSFDTASRAIYDKAAKIVKGKESSLPFDIIWAY